MPATPISVTRITRAGVAPVAFASSDPSNGNSISNDGGVWLEFSNTDASSRSVTITVAREVDDQAVTATPHTIPAGEQLRLGPFPPTDYGHTLNFTTTNALLKVAAYRLAD
jgi:hypothetical protein